MLAIWGIFEETTLLESIWPLSAPEHKGAIPSLWPLNGEIGTGPRFHSRLGVMINSG